MSDQPQLPLQLQALVNRLQARLGSGVADVAASVLAAAEAAPARASREWQLFWQEVELEAERLAQGDHSVADAATSPPPEPRSSDPQVLIDSLRARVAALGHRFDA